jgi:hypothetical protein
MQTLCQVCEGVCACDGRRPGAACLPTRARWPLQRAGGGASLVRPAHAVRAGWLGSDYQPPDPTVLRDRLARMEVLHADARIFRIKGFLTPGALSSVCTLRVLVRAAVAAAAHARLITAPQPVPKVVRDRGGARTPRPHHHAPCSLYRCGVAHTRP